MSNAISRELRDGNTIFNEQTLPANGNQLSPEFLCAGSTLGMEIVGKLVSELTVPAGKNFSVELLAAHGPEDSLVKHSTLFSVSASAEAAADTIEAGTEIFRFVPPSTIGPRMKLRLTNDTDLSSVKIDAYTVCKVH